MSPDCQSNSLYNMLEHKLSPDGASRTTGEIEHLSHSFSIEDWRQVMDCTYHLKGHQLADLQITEQPASFTLAVMPDTVAKFDSTVDKSETVAGVLGTFVGLAAGVFLRRAPIALGVVAAYDVGLLLIDKLAKSNEGRLEHVTIPKHGLKQ